MRKRWLWTPGLTGVVLLFAIGCSSNNRGRTSSAEGDASGANGTDGVASTDASDLPGTDATENTGGTDSTTATDTEPVIDLRVDTNRNGVIDVNDPTEDENEDQWSASSGAIFLANIDDDQAACETAGLGDQELPKCHDAADDVVNGSADLADFAPMVILPWKGAPDNVVGILSLSTPGNNYVRIFRGGATPEEFEVIGPGVPIPSEDLRAGVELFLEGTDVVRDAAVWDGFLDVTLTVGRKDGSEVWGTDTVRMRVAPMLTYHHLSDAQVVYAARLNGNASAAFRADLQTAMTSTATEADFYNVDYADQWAQDYLETGWMSMPTAEGQHVIRVNIRSPNVNNPNNLDNGLRYAGRVVYDLRGPDSAAIQQYSVEHAKAAGYMDSLNSFGNLETIPPYEGYPMGRIYRGSVETFYTDPSFDRMMEDQGMQEPVYVDTSWLLVGHVDETVTFVPVEDNDRGWTIAYNDPDLALQMLKEAKKAGHGDVVMFKGKEWSDDTPAEVTISEVLLNEDVLSESARAVVEVGAQLAILKEATGVTDEEMIRIPFLHESIQNYSVAYQPGTVNGIWLDRKNYAAPDPHGPVINGSDIFKKQLDEAFGAKGITVHYVEDWDLYHRLLGEVHCGSNATREIPTEKWWEAGE